jgi:hypothetical protein
MVSKSSRVFRKFNTRGIYIISSIVFLSVSISIAQLL